MVQKRTQVGKKWRECKPCADNNVLFVFFECRFKTGLRNEQLIVYESGSSQHDIPTNIIGLLMKPLWGYGVEAVRDYIVVGRSSRYQTIVYWSTNGVLSGISRSKYRRYKPKRTRRGVQACSTRWTVHGYVWCEVPYASSGNWVC